MLNKIIKIQFFKFLVVGFVNTIFGYVVFSFFVWIGLHYSLAALLATVLGVLFNFKTISVLVFNCYNNLLIIKFFGVYLIIYILNVIVLYLLNLHRINTYVSGAILILPLAVLSFLLNKKLVFKTND